MPCRIQSVNRLTRSGEQFLSHIVGDIAGRVVFALCAAESFHRDIMDTRGVGHRLGAVITALTFIGEIDDAAGINDIVGCIENAARRQIGAILRPFQLIVGGAGNDLRLELWNGSAIQFRAKGAG